MMLMKHSGGLRGETTLREHSGINVLSVIDSSLIGLEMHSTRGKPSHLGKASEVIALEDLHTATIEQA